MPSEKTLKRIVIILGVLIVGGFAVVVGTIIVRSLGGSPDQASEQSTTSFAIPDGAKILGGSRNGETIIFYFETLEGVEMVVVVDTRTGAVIGELEMEPR